MSGYSDAVEGEMEMQPETQGSVSAPEHALAMVRLSLERALGPDDAVTPAVEAQLQNALHLLRSARGDAEALGKLETASAMLQAMLVAKREHRPNLYESKRLRLRRLMLA